MHETAESLRGEQRPKNTHSRISLGLLFGAVFLLMLALNLMTPTWGDDWHRTLAGGDLIQTFKRIAWEYETWTGRASVLLFTYIALWLYPGTQAVFAVINAAAFCLLLLGMFWLASGRLPGRNRDDVLTLAAALGGVWLYLDAFGEGILWKTGAVGFLWVIAATQFLVKPFVDLLCHEPAQPNTAIRQYVLPFFYLLGAATLENLTAATAMLLVAALLWLRVVRRMQVPRWYLMAVVAYLCGTAILIAAPGNYARFAMQDDGIPMLARLWPMIVRIWEQGTRGTEVFYMLFALTFAALLFRVPIAGLRRAAIILLYGLASAMAMVGATGVSFSARTAFCSEVLFVAVGVSLFHAILAMQRSKFFAIGCTALLVVFLAPDMARTVSQYHATWEQTQRRDALMSLYRAYGIRQPYFPSYRIPYIDGLHDDLVRGRYFLRDIHMDIPGNGWRNGTFAEDHGFKFALRLETPYLIFEPELANRSVFRLEYEASDMRVLSRTEADNFLSQRVAYVIAVTGECYEAAAAATAAGLKYAWSFADTSLVGIDGELSTQHCIVRGIPQA